jgi:integrase
MSKKRFPFTKRTIEALEAHDAGSPSREAEYSDVECIGLKLRVSKGGRKFFQHRYRYLGRKKCLSIGEFPFVSIQEARQLVSEHKSLLAKRVDPANEKFRKLKDPNFSTFCKNFYIPHAKMHKKTWKEDTYKIKRQLIPAFGTYRLSTITTRDLMEFHSKQKERTSATTANHYMTLIKRMFNLAVKWGLLDKSPAANIDKFKEKPYRERYLTREELPRFLRAVEGLEDTLSKAAIKLLLFTGGRRGEILSLQWHQVKLNEQRIFLPETKNGKSRSILLNSRAMTVLRTLWKNKDLEPRTADSDYLFPSRGGSRRPHILDLRIPLGKVLEESGIENLRIHDLRHSFATLALQGGASLYDVSKLLGHSDISMTQRYAHMVDDSLQKATDNMAGVIDKVIGS